MNDRDDFDLDDLLVTFTVGHVEGWIELPLELSESETRWASRVLRSGHPEVPGQLLHTGVRNLAATLRRLHSMILPGTEMAFACQPDATGPVIAVLTIGLAPPELFPGDPATEVRHFERSGVAVGSTERTELTLPAGPAARVRAAVAQPRSKRFPWRGDIVTEGVTYFCRASAGDLGVVIDGWWQAYDLGDALAAHVDLIAETLRVAVEKPGPRDAPASTRRG